MQPAPPQELSSQCLEQIQQLSWEKNSLGLHPARRSMDAVGKWQQPLGELGVPALEATADFEGEVLPALAPSTV